MTSPLPTPIPAPTPSPSISVLIPARNEPFLQQTINSVLDTATGNVEVVVVLDGYWPNPPLTPNSQVVVIHHSEPRGMRASINLASMVARGSWLLKLDAHCIMAPGWDSDLLAHADPDTLSVPSRYGLDAENWLPKFDRPPVEYLYLTWPYAHEDQFGTGLHGKKWCVGSRGPQGWWAMENARKDIKIDDILIWQGSCWLLAAKTFRRLGMLDCLYSYNMFQEANELAFKMWLSGGRVVVNKHTWYAHWHKNTPSSYGLRTHTKKAAESSSTWFWMNDRWPLATRKFEWLVDKFWPLPDWPEDWQKQQREYEAAHPEVWGPAAFKVMNAGGHNGLGV